MKPIEIKLTYPKIVMIAVFIFSFFLATAFAIKPDIFQVQIARIQARIYTPSSEIPKVTSSETFLSEEKVSEHIDNILKLIQKISLRKTELDKEIKYNRSIVMAYNFDKGADKDIGQKHYRKIVVHLKNAFNEATTLEKKARNSKSILMGVQQELKTASIVAVSKEISNAVAEINSIASTLSSLGNNMSEYNGVPLEKLPN